MAWTSHRRARTGAEREKSWRKTSNVSARKTREQDYYPVSGKTNQARYLTHEASSLMQVGAGAAVAATVRIKKCVN